MSAAVVATRSRMPYVVLAGIALAIAAGLWASGLGADILRYRKDIVYLTKQHLVLVASGCRGRGWPAGRKPRSRRLTW